MQTHASCEQLTEYGWCLRVLSPSPCVLCAHLQLLTATTKLFFKRPPEVQKMLGRLLQRCLADGTSVALHDKYVQRYTPSLVPRNPVLDSVRSALVASLMVMLSSLLVMHSCMCVLACVWL